MQEDWGVFRNLPATSKRFTEQTGIDVEVTLTVIPEMWELMERSFSGEDPPFDLVGVDDLLLIQAARSGHVEPIDDLIAADGYSLDDFPRPAIDALTDGGRIWGLPYCFVSNVLIYQADLLEKHSIAVPQTLDELTAAAVAVQEGERAAGNEDLYGIAIRGAPNCGLNFWIIGSTWGPSFGARWYDDDGRPTLATPELIGAVEHYVDLVRRAGPPESPTMDFMDCMECYSAGRAAMTIEPANEASILYDEGGAVAEATRTALMPAGPLGTRHVGLYTPPYPIPSRSGSKDAAWELAKFLCARSRCLTMCRRAGSWRWLETRSCAIPRSVTAFGQSSCRRSSGHVRSRVASVRSPTTGCRSATSSAMRSFVCSRASWEPRRRWTTPSERSRRSGRPREYRSDQGVPFSSS
jgi:ABC-type glycerol-3-phosphate transport system substrate-binding protein